MTNGNMTKSNKKYTMKSLLFISSIMMSLLAFSCKSKTSIPNLDKDIVVFSLKNSACFGTCPVYKMEITNEGYATIKGTAHMDKIGVYGKQISANKLSELREKFAESNFQQFPDRYPSQIADLPTNTVGYHNGSAYREVAGKEERPEELMRLQFLLERIADSDGWTLIQSQQEVDHSTRPKVSNIYDEVIIEPHKGTVIKNWLESKDKYGVRLLKKIAPTLDLYLITYDSKLISAEEFQKALQRDEKIKSAEFNKKTTRR